MSWLRSAVNKAVDNKNNLTRRVNSVVHQAGQAVAEGAKILQDRIGNRNYKSVKQTVKRLEEAAVSCGGAERALLLKRWLFVLSRGVDKLPASPEDKDGAPPAVVLYYDPEIGGEPMTFQDVFLRSQALEGIALSMILEAPSKEEVELLLALFGICLTGGKEVHIGIVSSIQDLGTAFASYHDEVLVKREELLQFVQGAITGLKISADLVRIDAEAMDLRTKLDGIIAAEKPSSNDQDKVSEETTKAAIEALKRALTQIRICSRLERLLLKKKSLSFGDSPEVHAQKVDKLKVLSESLASSVAKAENRILDHGSQKEEALKVRAAKADEANEKEKEITAEIAILEKQRDEIEAELKKVNISLAAANARLQNAREERYQFDEANNQIVKHLKTKEDELSKSIAASKTEAQVLSMWINFLEDTWLLQCSYTESKEKLVKDELEKHEQYFTNLAISLLSGYKETLEPSISRIEKYVENLKNLIKGLEKASTADDTPIELNPRKSIEEEYLCYEAKIVTTFSVVDNMREHFYAQQRATVRKDDATVMQLFDEIEKLREEFDSIERPDLEMETPSPKSETASEKPVGSPSHLSMQDSRASKPETVEHPKAADLHDPAAELAELESECGKVGQDYPAEEIGDWEFDELERECRSSDTAPSK